MAPVIEVQNLKKYFPRGSSPEVFRCTGTRRSGLTSDMVMVPVRTDVMGCGRGHHEDY